MGAAPKSSRSAIILTACVILHMGFAVMAWFAAAGKCPTYDETLHAPSAWAIAHQGDFRVDPEDPPLWQYWAAIGQGRSSLPFDGSSPLWQVMLVEHEKHWNWCTRVLYQTEGFDGAAFVQSSRDMMVLVGLGLGALVTWFAWRMGGPTAALGATVLFALDPNFLAHGPLVKNDVAITLVFVGLAAAVWQMGRRVTIYNLLCFSVLCGAGVSIKFTGLAFGPVFAGLLLFRALSPEPWIVLKRTMVTRMGRVGTAAAICLVSGLCAWLMLWAVYGFRFSPTPDPSILLNTERFIAREAVEDLSARHPGTVPTTQEAMAWTPPLALRAILFCEEYRLLPQAWLNGFALMHESSRSRSTYLLGQRSLTGWWYYFPLAFLFKTPLATICAVGCASVITLRGALARWRLGGGWSFLCISFPVVYYFATVMSSNLNLGIRHLLPVYPLLFVGAGVAWSRLIQRGGWKWAGLAACVGLCVETMAAYPDFIPFFNTPSAAFGRLKLLSDSNLDWGQDLPLLAEWQAANPNRRLYLCYFGTVDPAFYGIRYTPLPGGFGYVSGQTFPAEPGVIAISATKLQGVYVPAPFKEAYARLATLKPLAVLGKSIYLYEFPTPEH